MISMIPSESDWKIDLFGNVVGLHLESPRGSDFQPSLQLDVLALLPSLAVREGHVSLYVPSRFSYKGPVKIVGYISPRMAKTWTPDAVPYRARYFISDERAILSSWLNCKDRNCKYMCDRPPYGANHDNTGLWIEGEKHSRVTFLASNLCQRNIPFPDRLACWSQVISPFGR